MKCNLKKRNIYVARFMKHNISREVDVYINEDFPLFGIVKAIGFFSKKKWGILHLPSEEAIICCLDSKKDAERYLDYLSKEIDLNSILLCTPKYRLIKKEIGQVVELSYQKFYREVKLK